MDSDIIVYKNGVARTLPSPTAFDPTYNPQSKSAERNGLGTLTRETLPSKWSLPIEWSMITDQEEFYSLFKFLVSLDRIDFDVEFPAPTGERLRRTFYLSPVSAKMLNFTGRMGWWKDLKCTFVEV